MKAYVHQKEQNQSRATANRRTTALHAPVNDSPRTRQVAQMQERINNSPRMVAQRKQLESAFGAPVQRGVMLEEEELQMKADPSENRTGLPDRLKAGVENLSGVDMSDVQVHYNSPKPAQLNALAYTQGANIHVAPGQERHLPHEAWHAVQQKQGRVQPTMQVKGTAVNDDTRLEKEADAMGAKASRVT